MPSVPKTSQEAIVAAARDLIDTGGLAALSVQAVAQSVGVQAPSLYKRFRDRAALIRAVAAELVSELDETIRLAATTGTPQGDLRALAHTQRAFAQRSPHLYQLVFNPSGVDGELDPDEYRPLVAVLVDRMQALVGKRDALPAARLLVSFTHGFVTMELGRAFRMGGDLDAAFRFGLERVLRSVTPAAKKRPPPK